MAGGRFITVEGGEGAGKSTQVARLCAALGARGLDVVATREPGGSPGAEDIRALLVNGDPDRWDAVSEALLHYAARHDHLCHTVKPALAHNSWVVCDRFADSTMAYQGYAHGLSRESIAGLHAFAVGETAPDLTLILDLPVEEGLARARTRAGAQDGAGGDDDRYERMDIEFHRKLREGFLDIAAREPARCVVIDAGADEDTVHAAMYAAVCKRFGLDAHG